MNNNIFEQTKEVSKGSNPDITSETFDDGYLEALDEIRRLLKEGSGPQGGGGGPQGKWPDPRLNMPVSKNSSSKDDPNNTKKGPKNQTTSIDGEEKNDETQEGQEKSQSEKAQDAANDAQSAADRAQSAADEAKEISDKLTSSGSPKADKAQKAADKAQKAADKAQKAADKAQKAADKAQKSENTSGKSENSSLAEQAQQAANEAKDAANEATIAANGIKDSDEIDGMTAREAAADAQKSASNARQSADDAKRQDPGNSENISDEIKESIKKAIEKAEKSAKDAEKYADQADKAAQKGDLEKAQELAKKAREASAIAEAAKNSAIRTIELYQDSEKNDYWSSGKMSEEDKAADPEAIKGDLFDCSKGVEKVIKRFSNKLTGPIGDFLDISRNAIEDVKKLNPKNKVALKSYALKAKNAWDIDFQEIIETYVSECIQEKKREMKSTYFRPNRRQGQVKTGDIIKKGKIPAKDKIDITMTFYIDISGSMSGSSVVNAFKAAYSFSDYIAERNEDEAVVGDFDYTFYAFNTSFKKIENKTIPSAYGSNVDFDELLDYISKHSLNDMINVIITDAQFGINPKESIEIIKKTEGLFIVIANNAKNATEFAKIKDVLKEKFEFLQADSNFTFKDPEER